MAISDRREAAQLLFTGGMQQKQIADMLKISESQLSKWQKEGKWRERRAEQRLAQQNGVDSIIEMIDNQTYVLKLLSRKYRAEVEVNGNDMTAEQLKSYLLANGQLDGLQKLYTTLKGKELGYEDYTTICTELIEFLSGRFPAIKELTPHIGDFLQSRRA